MACVVDIPQLNAVQEFLSLHSHPVFVPILHLPLCSPNVLSDRQPDQNLSLSSRRRLVHHLCLLFLESLSDSLTSRHELLYASADTIGFALHQRLGGEVVDAGIKAVCDKVREHLGGEGSALIVKCAAEA